MALTTLQNNSICPRCGEPVTLFRAAGDSKYLVNGEIRVAHWYCADECVWQQDIDDIEETYLALTEDNA